jgi:hypothetical protein
MEDLCVGGILLKEIYKIWVWGRRVDLYGSGGTSGGLLSTW